MAVTRSDNICQNKKEIQDYFGGISDYTFSKYVKCGMPARFEGRDWIAHKSNLDAWFKWYTRLPAQNYMGQGQGGEINFENNGGMARDEEVKST